MNLDNIKSKLKLLLNAQLTAIRIDNKFTHANQIKGDYQLGDSIDLFFSSGYYLSIKTNDAPHFYGEGDLELEFVPYTNDECLGYHYVGIYVEKIKLYFWKRRNLFGISNSIFFVHFELFCSDAYIASIGFLIESKNGMETVFLTGGDIAIKMNRNELNFKHFDNIVIEEIIYTGRDDFST